MAVPRKNFVLELTARKTGMLIFGKNQYCQTKPVTRNVFTNIIPQNDHNEISEWQITIIDHAETVKSLRRKELYWYHKLKTYTPFGLNERDV